ncbi:MAG: DUF29 domain-containing protein [Goleter apudmare HA4340-LM2]|nr:DUF29 domain-containing protein [Goleter apudmare HA4340-LM2]
MTETHTQKTLYHQDLVAWLDDTAIKLKQRRFEDIDIDSLIEEIEGLAGRDRRELKNRLVVLLNHLIKRLYVDLPNDYRGWELAIREQRRQLTDLLEQSPSLRNYWIEIFPTAWKTALSDTREDYSQFQLPDEWQFSSDINALLNEKFWKNHE